MATITRTKRKSKTDAIKSQPYKLITHNDDYNTFDWVIKCLIEVCKHTFEQASQCAHIVHYKGECDVKYGDLDTLNGMKEKLENAGLLVTVESN